MKTEEPNKIHSDMVFKLSNKRSPQEVKLRSLEWAVITQLNGEKSVGQIGEILALTPEETQDIFVRLIQEGLLDLVGIPDDRTYISPELFDDIEHQLILCLGPVASVVIDELLAEMNRSRGKFPKKQLPLLVELLSTEISNDQKRYTFQKYMLQKIKETH